MLQQTKIFKMKNKSGLSAVIGYVLLVSFSLIIAGIIYFWMQSYIPSSAEVECPPDVSIFINEIECNFPQLKLNIKNNGKFNINGYFIRGTTALDQEVATKDLSNKEGGIYLFDVEEGFLAPGTDETAIFDLSEFTSTEIFSIEIIPIRYEEVENKKKLATCNNAKIREQINCFP